MKVWPVICQNNLARFFHALGLPRPQAHHCTNELRHVAAQLIVLDGGIGTKQIDSAGLAEEAEGIVVLVGFMIAEQGRHRHFKELSDLLQPAAADAVRPFFRTSGSAGT